MANRGGLGRHGRRAYVALALVALAACAARSEWREGRFTHAKLGGSLGDLAALEPGWQRESAPGAALAFRHADGSRASWVRECRGVEAKPRALGRALWIALPGGVIEEGAALEVAGLPAWRFAGRAQDGANALRVESITRVAKRCEDSWLLVVPHSELHHREAFEQWLGGFADGGPADGGRAP